MQFSIGCSMCKHASCSVYPMQIVVNARKNAGGGLQGGYGNKVKLDPIVLALMEKRVAEQVEVERKKLISQFKQSNAGASEGEAMTSEQLCELAALRKRVEELDSRSKALVRSFHTSSFSAQISEVQNMHSTVTTTNLSWQDSGVVRLPSEVQSEMLRLRQEVERSRLKEMKLEEARMEAEQRFKDTAEVCPAFLWVDEIFF